jgi:CheY-like chemotaxis protein
VSQRPIDGRADTRVQAVFRVRYSSVDELVVAYSADLSRGGMFLQGEPSLPLNAVVRVHLELPNNAGEIPVICRVVFLRDEKAAAAIGSGVGMGVEFLDFGPEGMALLEELILQLSTQGRPPLPTHLPTPRLSVVVVDDDAAHRELAASTLRARGDLVRTAPDGLTALALCLKQVPDLILADVQMPRMDGFQLLRMVRARPSLSSVPVMFLTTSVGEEERLRSYQLGVDDYLPKPFQPGELVLRVERLVGRVQRALRPHIERKTLRGDLEQVSLPSLLGFLELERATGELFLVGEKKARLLLVDGHLASAELDGTHDTAAALAAVLDWQRGQFEFAAHDLMPDAAGLRLNLSALLLEHARRCDEQRHDAAAAPERPASDGGSDEPS